MSKEENIVITTADIILPSLDLGGTGRSQSGRRRAVETFQGQRGDLVSICLKPGYKVGKDSTGKKLMFVSDNNDTYSRRAAGIVTWLSTHFVVLGLVSSFGDERVDLEIEVPLEAVDSYRGLTIDSSKKVDCGSFHSEKGDLASVHLKPTYKLGKDSTGKKLMFVEDQDDSQSRRLSGIVSWISKHYLGIGLVSGVDNDKVDLEIEVPINAVDGYRALTADMTRRYMI